MNIRTKTINGYKYYIAIIVKDGKRSTVYAKTKKELKERYNKKIMEVEEEKVELEVNSSKSLVNLSLGEVINTWLNDTKKDNVRGTTYNCYSTVLKYILNDKIAKKNIKKIQLIEYQKFFNKLDKSDSTKILLKALLSDLYKYLMFNQIVSVNIIKGLVIKKDENKVLSLDKDYITKEEQEILVEKLKGTKYELEYLLMLYCGIRVGELIGLKRECINMTNHTISINQSWKRWKEDGVWVEVKDGPCKNKQSKRTIPYPPVLDKLILQRKDKYITNVTKATLNINLKKYDKNLHCHSLRHIASCRWLESNIPIHIIKKLMGHSPSSTTLLTTYSKVGDHIIFDMMSNFYESF